jgi:hypothetical protein
MMPRANKPILPEYVDLAFAAVYGAGYQERDREAFRERWDGLGLETFERVLKEGTGNDKVVAIAALGYAKAPQTRKLLFPLLQSPIRMERWESAIALGRLREEQALPVLHQCLQEARSAPSEVEAFNDENTWLDSSRTEISLLLGDWGQIPSIPVLRSAIKETWEWEQRFLADLPADRELVMLAPWEVYEYELAYALGQLGAFGALTGLVFSPSRTRILTVYMAMGHLQLRKKERDLFTSIAMKQATQKDVGKVLGQRFGFTEAEQNMYIKQFPRDYFPREAST